MGHYEEIPESRRAARRAVDIACEVIAGDGDLVIDARCTDLSRYGLWLADLLLDVGETVVVSFKPPRRDIELTVFGRVRNSADNGVGIELEGLSSFEEKMLRSALVGIPPRFPGKRDVASA